MSRGCRNVQEFKPRHSGYQTALSAVGSVTARTGPERAVRVPERAVRVPERAIRVPERESSTGARESSAGARESRTGAREKLLVRVTKRYIVELAWKDNSKISNRPIFKQGFT